MELVVGRVIRAHGIKGEAIVEIRTDDPVGRFAPGAVFATQPPDAGPLTVRSVRPHHGRLLVAFAGIPDRTAATGLRGVQLVVEAAAEEPPNGEDYYDQQLVGLVAVTDAGEPVGTVTEVLHRPAQDLLVVRRTAGADVLVPFVHEIVPVVDLTAGRIVLTPPPGLVDIGAAEPPGAQGADPLAHPPGGAARDDPPLGPQGDANSQKGR